MTEERFMSGSPQDGDWEQDKSLRPRGLKEYIGQSKVCDHLSIFIEAALARGEALDHVLLYGPPGLGKTTLANIIANELSVSIRVTSGPAIERPGDLAAILTALEPRDVLFIDEIHRLNRTAEEILYSAMEDFSLDIVIGKGPSARSVRISIPPFTLVGATTRAGQLTSPLRDRFGVINRLEFYTVGELEQIVSRSGQLLGVVMEEDGIREIARRSRGTPRIANRLLKRVRDYAQVRANGVVSNQVAREALDLLEIDSLGLDRIDRKLLDTIINKFTGGPVGLDTLAATIGEDPLTIEDVYEPFLLQLGFLNRTPRGRVATSNVYRHLGLTPPSEQEGIFTRD